jgi:predicted amidophosphoribosyltransferase
MEATLRPVEVPLGGRFAAPASPLSSPAAADFAICATCHGPAAPGHVRCWSCHVVSRQLRTRTPPVVPVFLFGLGSPVHRALVGYKAGIASAGRAARAEALGGMLGEFLRAHTSCLLGDADAGVLVPVPSSIGGRRSWNGRHPIAGLCERAAGQVPRLETAELLRAGDRPPRRLEARVSGYEVAEETGVGGQAVIVVDDMFVSGARALSAAAALTVAGAHVAAVVPLGRLVRPDHNAATAAFFATHSLQAFDLARCALCGHGGRRQQVVAWEATSTAVSERLAA